MKKLMMAAALAAMACGCITVNRNDGGNSDLRPPVAKDIVHEKLSVGEVPVTAQETINTLFGFISWGGKATHWCDQAEFSGFGSTSVAKNGAYANACDAAGCDQIAAARYKVTVSDYFVFSKTKAEITGYPVKLEGVEVIENKFPTPPPARSGCGLL